MKCRLNEVIPHGMRSVNCRFSLQHFNEYHAYEYSQIDKSTNKVLADLQNLIQNVTQSFEYGQQFDYLFKWTGLKLIVCWDFKEHHIIIIIIKNHNGKISIEFPGSVSLKKSCFNLD